MKRVNNRLSETLNKKVLCLDGAMGTMVQQRRANSKTFKNENHDNNIDMMVLNDPELIRGIHRSYLESGADVIETNTFNAQTISQADFNTAHLVEQINKEAARLAREEADRYTKITPDKPRFVLGSVGPTNKTASMSPDVMDVAKRNISWEVLTTAYYQQCQTLVKAGVDGLIFETTFDILNAKAGLWAAQRAMEDVGIIVPLFLSITLTESGRTLSGQTIEATLASVSHIPLLSVGFNCAFGADKLVPYVRELAQISPYNITVYPNAGLPNELGNYDQTPEEMVEQMRPLIDEGLINMIGGCCGTTEKHIKLIAELCKNAPPRKAVPAPKNMILAGLEPLPITPERNMTHIGERCNVAGSRKFLRLINTKEYEEAMQIAKQQVEDGALILDINMDDGLLEAKEEMVHFVRALASDPVIASRPWMIDSSDFEVIKAALKEIQGKPIVNSISLKEGEEKFIIRATEIKQMGAATVVMAFDEKGQADTYERKIEVCERAYHILIDQIGFPCQDIIFDPNVLSICTGMEEHRNYALNFIRATKWIKNNLPGVHISGGISNLSFSFRGNNYLREAMHAVFLYHAINAGLDMAIVNPATKIMYNDIPTNHLKILEDVIMNPSKKAEECCIALAEKLFSEKDALKQKGSEIPKIKLAWRETSVDERLKYALQHGESNFLNQDIAETLTIYPSAVSIIEGPLLAGMKYVGDLFAVGQMFLPQVVKAARTMQQAVAMLKPYIEAERTVSSSSGKVLLATVKGDVHDIGKNIVSVVMSCAEFEIIDLGVMVPAEKILEVAKAENVDIICLSGLITPSLLEMTNVVKLLEANGVTTPVMIGGATTSEIHTALKIAPHYSGIVVRTNDASSAVLFASKLMDPKIRTNLKNEIDAQNKELRKQYFAKKEKTVVVPFNKIRH